ncbi:chromate transporter [Roseomonas sp. NAR14]|uniref:Chromate transporter n=1 Tax=Roseomonas acroporae TaxID=2937791 RepID=A0A9X1Y632_9PROT|nr:chromate transporter [Roseomonas acroporae]
MSAPDKTPDLGAIFLAFAKIGLTSFGGGLSGWMLREFVQNRRWLDEAEFLNGLSLAQAFPGVNVVNLAVWIGYRLRGGRGSLVAVLGMVVPAMFVAIGAAALFAHLSRFHATHVVLAGIGAAAVGLSLQMGVRAARRAARSAMPVAIMAAVFLAIFAFRLPLLWVVLVAAPASIAWAALHPPARAGRRA